MMRKHLGLAMMVCACWASAALRADQNIVKNGSMESGPGPNGIDPQVAANWTEAGINIERSDQYNLVPAGAGHALKAFGDGQSSSVSAYQEVSNINPGQSVTASVKLFSPANDKLGGSGEAGLVLEFLDLFGGTIQLHQTYVLNSGSPANTWISATLGPLTAPSGTKKVRVTCRLKWNVGNVFGAAYWDDAQLTVNGGPNLLLNGNFETAGNSPGQSPLGIDDWVGFNDQEKSADVARHGASSAKIGTREAYSGLYQNMGVLNAGDRIFMLAYVRNPSGDPLTGNSRAGIKLEFDPNAQVPPPEENLAFTAADDPDEWTLVSLNTTVPAAATIARVVLIYVGDAQTSGSVHFDAAYAERGSVPSVNQLLNEGFENGSGGFNGIDHWTEFNGGGSSQAQKSCFEVFPEVDGDCDMRATGQAVSGIYQEFAVTGGESLSIHAWLQTPSFEKLTGAGAKAGVKIEWAVGGVPADVDIGGATNTIAAGAPTNTWIPIYIDYTMPPGSSALARFTCLVEKSTGLTGKVYFDACEAVVIDRFNGCDADGDGDEDMHDFAGIQKAFAGGNVVPTDWPWVVYDTDEDDDVDLVNTDFFIPRLTGPN